VPAQVSHGTECWCDSWAGGQLERGHGGPQPLALACRQDERRRLVGLGARKTPEEQQLPGDG